MRIFHQLRQISHSIRQEMALYRLVMADSRTPKIAKLWLGLALVYLWLPFDLIPDFIPIIGHLDDAILIPLFILIAWKLIPSEIIRDCRNQLLGSEQTEPIIL